jgi:hypothetical protein
VLAAEQVVDRLGDELALQPITSEFALKGVSHAPIVFEVVSRATG